MADFSIQDAAFTGFSVVREHRRYVPIWAGLALAFSMLLTAAMIAIAGPALQMLQTLSVSGDRNPAIVLPALARLAPLSVITIPASVVFYGVLCSAMNRAVLRPSDAKFAFFAFGADEFRQIGLFTLGSIFFGVVYFLLVLSLAIMAALLNSLFAAPPAFLALTAVGLAMAVMIWLAVRLSMASALTFERGRVTFFGSWALTKGRFWSIFGTYVLVVALGAVIYLLTWLVILAIVTVFSGGNLSAALASPDFRSLSAYFTIAQLVQLVLGAGVSALMWPVLLSPPAAIFRQISAAREPHINRREGS